MSDQRLLGGERLTATSERLSNYFSWLLVFVLGACIVSAAASAAWQLRNASSATLWAHSYSVARIDFGVPWPAILFAYPPLSKRLSDARIDPQNPRQMHELDNRLRNWRQERTAPLLHGIAYSAAGGGLLGLVLFIVVVRRFGNSARNRDHKRGALLVSPSQLAKLVQKASRGKPRLTVAGVPLPAGAEYQHSLFSGTTGAGKSQAVEDRLAQIRKLGERAIIYDPDRELISHFLGREDHIINPFDSGSQAWDIRREIRAEPDCHAISESLIQPGPGQGQNEFFYQAAAQIFAAALASGDDPFRMLELTTEQLADRLGGSAAAILGGKSGAEVHKTVLSRTRGFNYLEGLQSEGAPCFSVRDWVESGTGWLWLTSRDDVHSALSPMLSLSIEVAALQILSRADNQGDPIHIVLDELASLQRLPALLRLLARGRKRKAAVLLATQSPAQIAAIYGREGAQALNDTVGTRLIMRLEDPESAEFASKFLGEHETLDRVVNQNMGQRRQGSNISEQLRKERIVLPSEIQALPDLSAFLKLAGGLPPAKVKCKYVARKKVAEGYVAREIDWSSRPVAKSPAASINPLDDL